MSPSLSSPPLTVIQVHATQLYQASFMGSIDEVKELLEGGANVNEPNDVRKIDIDKMDEIQLAI